MEVAHTLMDMGALIGGPMRDFPKALNCFKEALFIYRRQLEEIGSSQDTQSSSQAFLSHDNTDVEEIEKHVENALNNINLIEAALMKDRDGASTRKRR